MELQLSLSILAGLVGFFFLYKHFVREKNKKKSNQAPEPAGAWPIIGHLHLMRGNGHLVRTLGGMADKNGPAFMLRLGLKRMLVISSWKVAKECFTTNDKVLASRAPSATGKHLGYDYALFGVSPYGPYWREVRRMATLELLSNRQLDLLKHVRAAEIHTCMKELYGQWAEKGNLPATVEMNEKFGELTFNIVVRMIAGKRYFGTTVAGEKEEARLFRQVIVEMFRLAGILVPSDSFPFLKWLDVQGHESAMKKTAKELDTVLSIWLEEHRRERLSGEVKDRGDFIHVMLSKLENAQISDYDNDTIIKATSLALILGGTETTEVTLTWALSLLLNNPSVLKKAQDELDMQIGKDRNVEESDIKNLVYLQAIIKETMRLYPAAPLAFPHQATEDCYINGYHVQAGTWIRTNIWKIQRDPTMWSDPLEFRPERFLTSHAGVDYRGQDFEYIPFGSGRRSCPGISFAAQVMNLALARLLHGFDVVSSSGVPVDMSEGLALTLPKRTPLEVQFTPRLPSKLYA